MKDNETNALAALAQDPIAVLGDGITGFEPVFNVALMTELAKAELAKLEALPHSDLTTEEGRKILRKAVKPVKDTFADFEKNIKIVKKSSSEIPKKCDAVSKALRDLSEPSIAKALAPLEELREQEILTTKWWRKEGIPHTKYDLENGLQALKNAEPSKYSSSAEIADFSTHQASYIEEWEKCLDRIYVAEQAERERAESQKKEAERLRLQAEEQRKAQAAIEAEQRRLAAEAAKLEAARLESERQAAVNPANPESRANGNPEGAPAAPALSEYQKKTMRRAAVDALSKSIAALGFGDETSDALALHVCKCIHAGSVPHVRFFYGEGAI